MNLAEESRRTQDLFRVRRRPRGIRYLDHIALTIMQETKMSDNGTHTWPELAIGLFEQLTGKNAEIIYTFEEMSVHVPSGTGDSAKLAPWKLNGTMRIRTKTHESQ
jgi:hypothetical protein